MLSRDRALAILDECSGDDIWSVEHCRARRVPEAWINELADAFESSFFVDSQTIYLDRQRLAQYHGVRDVDLATRVAATLGLDVDRLLARALSRRDAVRAIKEAVMEGE